MRLSDWRRSAPYRDSLGPKVLGVVGPVMRGLGAEEDPHAWVFWGDDAAIRFLIFVITPAGLVSCHVRVNVPGEGPRASGKLTRWTRVQIGEVTVETGVGGRLVTAGQIENQVMRVAGDEAELAARFLQGVLAAIDGRPIPSLDVPRRRGRRVGKPVAKAQAARGADSREGAAGPEAGAQRAWVRPPDDDPSTDHATARPADWLTTTPDPASPRSASPAPGRIAAWRLTVRYWLIKAVLSVAVRAYVRLRVDGSQHLPSGPSLLCLNHLSWVDPIIVIAAVPGRPRLHFFGPREEDMGLGGRNRLMTWAGTAVPFKPEKSDLLATARKVQAVFDSGRRLAIFAEGRIHAREGELLPLEPGAVWFALRSGVPLVPVAIEGTSWLAFGRTVRVTIGEPLVFDGRPTAEAVDAATARTWCALFDLTRDARPRTRPGPVGRWLTERFNDWPDGGRPDRTPGATSPPAEGGPVIGPHGPCPPPPPARHDAASEASGILARDP